MHMSRAVLRLPDGSNVQRFAPGSGGVIAIVGATVIDGTGFTGFPMRRSRFVARTSPRSAPAQTSACLTVPHHRWARQVCHARVRRYRCARQHLQWLGELRTLPGPLCRHRRRGGAAALQSTA